MKPGHQIKLNKEQCSKLVFLGMDPNMYRFKWSGIEIGMMWAERDKHPDGRFVQVLYSKNRPTNGPYAYFHTVEEALIALMDTSGNYWWK